MNEGDFSDLPRGQRGWLELITTLSEVDDRIERHFLEVKSDVDLNKTSGREKVAKFVLGAANRDPERAAAYFNGHAVMILGVAKGRVTGIPGFEAHELEQDVQKYTGIPAPAWDHERIQVTPDRDVIAIVVAPPEADRVWSCRRDGDKLVNGAIYLRVDGATRPAKGDEVQAMLTRIREVAAGSASFEVSVVGYAYPLETADEVLNDYLDAHRQSLMAAWRRHHTTERGTSWGPLTGFNVPVINVRSPLMQPDQRNHDDYVEQIEAWERATKQAWPALIDHVIGAVGCGTYVRVRNLSDTFVEGLLVKVHIEGTVEAIEAVTSNHFDPSAQLPPPPDEFGPKMMDFVGRSTVSPYLAPGPAMFGTNPLGRVSFENGGSTNLTLQLADLRPRSTHDSDADEFVLVVRDVDPAVTQLRGHWEITARGHHRVYEGELGVPVKHAAFSADALRTELLESPTDDDDD